VAGTQDIISVDARGLSCPQPVVLTRLAIAGLTSGVVEVLVDTATQRDNVARVVEKEGWAATVEETTDGIFRIMLHK
jgi:TusA-related sulfurtransferase